MEKEILINPILVINSDVILTKIALIQSVTFVLPYEFHVFTVCIPAEITVGI